MRYIPESSGNWIEGSGYRKKILLKEDELRSPGTLVQVIEIEPYTSVPFHYHKSCLEVFHVTLGTGSMTIDGVAHKLSPGDTLTCEPGQVHNAVNDSGQPWRYVVFKTNVCLDDTVWLDKESA